MARYKVTELKLSINLAINRSRITLIPQIHEYSASVYRKALKVFVYFVIFVTFGME